MNPYIGELAEIWDLGFDEARLSTGRTYDDDPLSPRSRAYDEGRTAGEWVPLTDEAKAATLKMLEGDPLAGVPGPWNA